MTIEAEMNVRHGPVFMMSRETKIVVVWLLRYANHHQPLRSDRLNHLKFEKILFHVKLFHWKIKFPKTHEFKWNKQMTRFVIVT